MNLYKTTALVTAFTIFEHALGFVYRIILSRTLGPEGLGVYQVALTVFAVFLTISSSGLPITLSRTISKHRARGYLAGENKATTAAIMLSAAVSGAITLILFLLRTPFSCIFSDPRSADVFYIVLPGLTFTSVYAMIRGSFWGNKRFFAYSLIELIEEIIMILVGVALLVFTAGTIADVNKAGVAVLISYLCSFTIASLYFWSKGGRLRSPKGEIMPLLRSSLPVTAMRTLSSLAGSLISVLFPLRMMAAGMSRAQAMSAYGIIGGMVMPVLMIPNSFISSIALVLVPEMAECYYKKDREKLAALTAKALNAAFLLAGALIPLFLSCGEGVGIFLFRNAESGKLIASSALMLLPMSISLIATSMLNSMGCEKQTLLFFLLGAGALIACVWILPPYLGSGALLVGMAAEYILTAVCSLVLLVKKTGRLRSGSYFLRVLLCASLSSLIGVLLENILMAVLSYIPAHLITMFAVGASELALFRIFHLFYPVAFLKKFLRKKAKRRRLPKAA